MNIHPPPPINALVSPLVVALFSEHPAYSEDLVKIALFSIDWSFKRRKGGKRLQDISFGERLGRKSWTSQGDKKWRRLIENKITNSVYTLCIMSRLCLGPENESLQNEVDRSIFTSKYVFVLVTKSTQQKHKTKSICWNYMFRNEFALPISF